MTTHSGERSHIVILSPVYNDWVSFGQLVEDLDEIARASAFDCSIVGVDDGSTDPTLEPADVNVGSGLRVLEVLRLTRNLGHQKAIAIGLAYIAEHRPCDAVVVMDADGEDRPDDVPRLIDASRASPGKIVFARRATRSEGLAFRLLYRVYRAVYYLFSGSAISFGNFSIIPSDALRRLVFVSEIWNHFSAGVMKSRLAISTISTTRGARVAGRSKMNLASLVMHGLSAISVHMDIVAVRLFLASLGLIGLSIIGMGIVVGIRLFTALAIPGWATNVTVGLTIILMQAFLMSFLLVFLILTYRTQKLFVPRSDYAGFILRVETLHPRP